MKERKWFYTLLGLLTIGCALILSCAKGFKHKEDVE